MDDLGKGVGRQLQRKVEKSTDDGGLDVVYLVRFSSSFLLVFRRCGVRLDAFCVSWC
jgi:hypothetical protein